MVCIDMKKIAAGPAGGVCCLLCVALVQALRLGKLGAIVLGGSKLVSCASQSTSYLGQSPIFDTPPVMCLGANFGMLIKPKSFMVVPRREALELEEARQFYEEEVVKDRTERIARSKIVGSAGQRPGVADVQMWVDYEKRCSKSSPEALQNMLAKHNDANVIMKEASTYNELYCRIYEHFSKFYRRLPPPQKITKTGGVVKKYKAYTNAYESRDIAYLLYHFDIRNNNAQPKCLAVQARGPGGEVQGDSASGSNWYIFEIKELDRLYDACIRAMHKPAAFSTANRLCLYYARHFLEFVAGQQELVNSPKLPNGYKLVGNFSQLSDNIQLRKTSTA